MTKVFIAGSRRLSRLPPEVKTRLDTMIEKRFAILVGDANGADKAVQRYLAERAYGNVTVYCMAGNCRNNLGVWSRHEVAAPRGAKGRAYYSAKDLAMVADAEYGLMLWDGESRGTLNDVVQMVRHAKPVVVYLTQIKSFENLRMASDLSHLLAKCDPAVAKELEIELGISNTPSGTPVLG